MSDDAMKLCTLCKKSEADVVFAPFCSKRCADIDLGRWLKGGYAIPGRDGEAASALNRRSEDDDL